MSTGVFDAAIWVTGSITFNIDGFIANKIPEMQYSSFSGGRGNLLFGQE